MFPTSSWKESSYKLLKQKSIASSQNRVLFFLFFFFMEEGGMAAGQREVPTAHFYPLPRTGMV